VVEKFKIFLFFIEKRYLNNKKIELKTIQRFISILNQV